MNAQQGIFFPEPLQQKLRQSFYHVDEDPFGGERLFFDNSGGSLRLKSCVAAKAALEELPDCPERTHPRALELKRLVTDTTEDILRTVFGASDGALITELTASQVMFHMVELILENVPGTNAVVSSLEHPSAYDAVAYYCRKTGKELRVVPADPQTGGIRPEAVADLVDQDTCLVSVMYASNVTGRVMDMERIVQLARQINPQVYVISDAVQHAPHALIEAERLGLDGVNFAPYKFFGVRGCGFGYVSPRVARLPHRKLLAKDPEVFELGTSAPGNFAATRAVIDYVCAIGGQFTEETDRRLMYQEGINRIHLQERALLHRMLEGTREVPGLRHIPGVHVHADTEDLEGRDLIAAISIDGLEHSQCVRVYGEHGIIVCDRVLGSMYARRILKALGLKGAVRVSPLHCHSPEDIDRFLKVTAAIAREYA